MTRALPTLLAAGFALALFELVFAWARGHALFLTTRELAEYGLAALLGQGSCVLALGAVFQAARRRSVYTWSVLGVGALSGAWAGWLLTEGRRVRDLAVRPLLVLLFGVLLAGVLWGCLRWLRRQETRPALRYGGGVLLTLLAVASVLADAWVLPRGYPAFHALLSASALGCAALLGLALTRDHAASPRRWARPLALAVLVLAPLALRHLAMQPNASYAVVEKAPLTAKLMKPFARLQASGGQAARSAGDAPELLEAQAGGEGIDLRDRDLLLITVDALRADSLASLGGKGVMPALDALAAESMVFRRAYTPAPHTSYALASLLTAKFIKPVMELASGSADHPTLPDLLKRYSYRTAAFYPPAIFFVDGPRFQALAGRAFGFEYRKEMYASAEARVEQLRTYLQEVEPGHPLFVWVHLFEPHEPYDPPSEFAKDPSARGRYEGEVSYSDHAIGRMVQLFRAARPGATVVVTADHGEEFGEHGGSFHGSTLYDEQVRVPVVWSSPSLVPPRISDVPIELVDLGATILSSAGIPRDPRMRGDDLGPVLRGSGGGPRFAFASVEERHMVTDGRYKAICAAQEQHCQLFDLVSDPREQHNLAGQQPDQVTAMQKPLAAFLSSIAQREALAVQDGVGFPEPLVRARLGVPGAGPGVLPLLGDARATVRAASARVLGELSVQAARPTLERMASSDPDAAVRGEAAVAAVLLGSELTRDAVVAQLSLAEHADDGLSLPRRAALALASRGDARAIPVLAALVRDAAAQESDRLRAVQALGALGQESGSAALIEALGSVRLREPAAAALARTGGSAAKQALYEQLVNERYPPARAAEASALWALGDARVLSQVERFLGMETSLPGGLGLLVRAGRLNKASARGSLVAPPGARRGSWSCDGTCCVPERDAQLLLPAASTRAEQRVTLLVGEAAPGSQLRVAEHAFTLTAGEQQVAFWRSEPGAHPLPVAVQGRASICAWLSVPRSPEIPAPPPEPWESDAGAEAGL